MMGTTFTPGPWRVMHAGNANDEHARTIRADGGAWVADVLRQGTESARASNARLIAAAPDLYAAVESLLALHADDGTRDDVPEWKAARAALAKARGENGGGQ